MFFLTNSTMGFITMKTPFGIGTYFDFFQPRNKQIQVTRGDINPRKTPKQSGRGGFPSGSFCCPTTFSSKSKFRRKIQNFKTNSWQESIGLNFSRWIPLCARVLSFFFGGGDVKSYISQFSGVDWITCDLWFWPPKYLVSVVVPDICYFYPYLGKIFD